MFTDIYIYIYIYVYIYMDKNVYAYIAKTNNQNLLYKTIKNIKNIKNYYYIYQLHKPMAFFYNGLFYI